MSIKNIKEKYIDVFLILALVLLVGMLINRFFLKDRNKSPEFDPGFTHKSHLVTEVIDGDTIVVDNNREISLLGVDAPKGNECWAQESKDELTDLLKDEYIQLHDSSSAKNNLEVLFWYVFLPDKYKEVDTLRVNEYLLSGGYAKVAQDYKDIFFDDLLLLQQYAIENQKGMWAVCPLE